MAKPESWDNVESEALTVNKLTKEELEKAPEIKLVWSQFVNWVQKYNRGKNNDVWSAPVACGYNILGYDMPLTSKYCQRYKTAWDEKRNSAKLFHPIHVIDLMHHMFFWTESLPEPRYLKLTAVQEWMGFAKANIEEAHNALSDVKACTKILQKLISLERYLVLPREDLPPRLIMKNCFAKKEELAGEVSADK